MIHIMMLRRQHDIQTRLHHQPHSNNNNNNNNRNTQQSTHLWAVWWSKLLSASAVSQRDCDSSLQDTHAAACQPHTPACELTQCGGKATTLFVVVLICSLGVDDER